MVAPKISDQLALMALHGIAHFAKTCKLVLNKPLATILPYKPKLLQCSPQQIAGWLKQTYPDDESYQASHEAIYRSLFIQARGALTSYSEHARSRLKIKLWAVSKAPYPLESSQQRRRIAQCQGIGRAIFCMEMPIARSLPS
jgi:IS30 family transposase